MQTTLICGYMVNQIAALVAMWETRIAYMGNAKYPWRTIGFDETFLMKGTQTSVSNAAYKAGNRTGKKFNCRSVGNGLVEVKRSRSAIMPDNPFVIRSGATRDYLVSFIKDAESFSGIHDIDNFSSFMHRCIVNDEKDIVKHFTEGREDIRERIKDAFWSEKLEGNKDLAFVGEGDVYVEHDNYAFKLWNDFDMLVMRKIG